MLSSCPLLDKCQRHREILGALEPDAQVDTRSSCFVGVIQVGPDPAKCLYTVEAKDFVIGRRGISTIELEYRPG